MEFGISTKSGIRGNWTYPLMDLWKKFSISFVTPKNGWIVVLCIEKKLTIQIEMPSWKRINCFVCQNVFVNYIGALGMYTCFEFSFISFVYPIHYLHNQLSKILNFSSIGIWTYISMIKEKCLRLGVCIIYNTSEVWPAFG